MSHSRAKYVTEGTDLDGELLHLGGVKHFNCLHTHEVGQTLSIKVVLIGDVSEGLLATAHGLELGDTDARAVKLADGVLGLLVCAGAVVRSLLPAVGVLGDVIAGPEEGEGLSLEAEGRQQGGDVIVQLLDEALVLGVTGLEVGVLGVATNSGETAAHGLLVDGHLAGVTSHQDTDLTLVNAGEETLVNKLATGRLASLEVLAGEGGLPLAGAGGVGAINAEGEELLDSVVLDVVVVHLHELELVVILKAALAVALGRVDLADVIGLGVHEPAQPDALTSRAAVLLDDAGLEGAGLLEALLELRGAVVGKGVLQTAVEVTDLHEGILGTHLGLDLGGGPHELASGDVAVHELIELLLGALGGSLGQLPGVDADDQGIVGGGGGHETVVVVGVVKDEVAGTSGLDDGVGDRDGVDAVAVRALVGASVLGAGHLELHDAKLVLGVGGGLAEGVVACSRHLGWCGGDW